MNYGYKQDRPDRRDLIFAPLMLHLPSHVDLTTSCPSIYDQGQLGSCTANAIAAAIEFDQMKQGLKPFVPSRLFIYYNERRLEGTVNEDAGAEIRDGIKVVNADGACPEELWPYDISKFSTQPPIDCYQQARKDRVLKYYRVFQCSYLMRACLAQGYPFVFGFTVFESFESAEVAQTGVVNLPQPNENMIGGHAVMAVGYDDATQRFIVRNSWGTGWGQQGYFTMPYKYLTDSNLASDFWTIRVVQEG